MTFHLRELGIKALPIYGKSVLWGEGYACPNGTSVPQKLFTVVNPPRGDAGS